MTKLVGASLLLLASPLVALFGLVTIAGGASSGSGAAAGHATFNPSEEALADIPLGLIGVYTTAASGCIGLPWQVLAAVARVESNHGRFGGATFDAA